MSTAETNETSNYEDIPAVAIQVSRNIVVASIQVDLDDDVIARFRDDLLRRIHETDSRGVILDLSGLDTLDSHEFTGLRSIISMSTLMGAQSILVGMRPGVVSALIEVGADVDGLLSAIDLDAGYAMLAPEPEPEPEPETETETETEEQLKSATGVQDELPQYPGEGI